MSPSIDLVRTPDLLDVEALRKAVGDCDAVIHLAARVHVLRDDERDALPAYRAINVEGTRLVLQEAIRAGVRTFIFVSSVKAIGETNAAPWREDVDPAPVDPYGISKLEAERMVIGMARESGIVAPIARLPLVYGPGVRANVLRLFKLIDRGFPLPFGGISNRRSLLYVGNLAAALQHLLELRSASDPVFFVSDGADLSTPELIRRIAAALDRPARLVPCPTRLLRLLAPIGDAVERFVPVPLTSGTLDRLLGSLTIDASKLSRLTGYRAPFSVDEGLRATAEWHRSSLHARSRQGDYL